MDTSEMNQPADGGSYLQKIAYLFPGLERTLGGVRGGSDWNSAFGVMNRASSCLRKRKTSTLPDSMISFNAKIIVVPGGLLFWFDFWPHVLPSVSPRKLQFPPLGQKRAPKSGVKRWVM